MCVTCRKNRNKAVLRSTSPVDNCTYLMTELINLRIKLTEIYHKSSDSNIPTSINTITKWTVHLNTECPPEDDINIIRTFVDNEYPKYFPDNTK